MEQPQRIFITGATGFIGREICLQLLDSNFQVTALLRKGSHLPHQLRNHDALSIHYGDAVNPGSLRDALSGHDAVIHLVGIIREFPQKGITFKRLHVESTQNMVDLAFESGVKRFLHMSALGTQKKSNNEYHHTKWQAEEILRHSQLDFTIFRPSIVFGEHDQFTNMIADMIRKTHVFPLIGRGKAKLQPLSVTDVAEGFVKSLSWYPSVGRTYEIGGYEILQFSEIVREIGRACNTWFFTPKMPISVLRPFSRLFGKFSWFPITTTQLQMLTEDNITDNFLFFEDFRIAPTNFKNGIKNYLSDN